MIKYLLPFFLIPLLVACMGNNQKPSSGKPVSTSIPTEEKACIKQGGKWVRAGLAGGYMCLIKAKDAGKSCTDSAQCEYRCIANISESVQPGGKGSGQCQTTNSHFGCYSVVKDGVVQPAICVD